jgi:GT2 family glycosyltransferase
VVPEIDVLTPSFGYGRFLNDALESVRRQHGVRATHYIQDAGSQDETLQVLENAPDVVWESRPDRGQSDALNLAYGRGSAEWIGWLNADEFYLSGALKALVNAASRSSADVVFGDVAFVDNDGRFLRLRGGHGMITPALRHYGMFLPSCGTLLRRAVLDAAPWDVGLRRLMDWDLALRLVEKGAVFRYVPVTVAAFRIHDAQVTAQPAAAHADEYERVRSRYSIHATRQAALGGRLLHVLAKISNGAYVREWRAGQRYEDMRWFAGSD